MLNREIEDLSLVVFDRFEVVFLLDFVLFNNFDIDEGFDDQVVDQQ
jgi:hypothetical protein